MATEHVLRPFGRPGDLGWVVERHGTLYAEQFGWDASFERLVARIALDFAEEHDPERERAWIAELGGRRVGCVLCVQRDERTAQLRILLVDAPARGRGVGRDLVGACVRFAREAGYEELALWTNGVLVARATSTRPLASACRRRRPTTASAAT